MINGRNNQFNSGINITFQFATAPPSTPLNRSFNFHDSWLLVSHKTNGSMLDGHPRRR